MPPGICSQVWHPETKVGRGVMIDTNLKGRSQGQIDTNLKGPSIGGEGRAANLAQIL